MEEAPPRPEADLPGTCRGSRSPAGQPLSPSSGRGGSGQQAACRGHRLHPPRPSPRRPWLWGGTCRKPCRPRPGCRSSTAREPHPARGPPSGRMMLEPPTPASPPVGTAFTQTLGENTRTLASGRPQSCKRWTVQGGLGAQATSGRQEGGQGWAGRPAPPAGHGREERVPWGRAHPGGLRWHMGVLALHPAHWGPGVQVGRCEAGRPGRRALTLCPCSQPRRRVLAEVHSVRGGE